MSIEPKFKCGDKIKFRARGATFTVVRSWIDEDGEDMVSYNTPGSGVQWAPSEWFTKIEEE